MYSVGDCCSPHANYSVFVSRSRSPVGPFTPDQHNPILMSNRHFWAVGHNSTIADAAGVQWIVYHARIRGDVTQDRYLMLDRIDWAAGWPVIDAGRGPSSSAEAPTVR